MKIIHDLCNVKNRSGIFIAFYIGVSIFINFSFVYVYTIEGSWKKSIESLIILNGDGKQYVESAESVYQGNDFVFYRTDKEKQFKSNFIIEGNYDKGIYYTGRTPGYAFLYLPIRFFFNKENTLFLLLLLQILLNAVSKVILSIIVYRFTKKPIAFFTAFIITNLSFVFPFYNHIILTESFAGSFLILAFYFYQSSLYKKQYIMLLLSGICLTQAAMLRPFLLPIFFFIVLFQWIQIRKFSYFISKQLLCFLLPLSMVLVPWTIRNYSKTGEIIVLPRTNSWLDFTNKSWQQVIYLTTISGDKVEWWDPHTLTHWFNDETMSYNVSKCPAVKGLETKTLTNLEKARKLYLQSQDELHYNLDERKLFEVSSEHLVIGVIKDYKIKHPLTRVSSKLKILVKYIDIPLFKPLYSKGYLIRIASLFIESFINMLIMIVGCVLCIVYLANKNSNQLIKIISLSSLFLIFYFSTFRYFETREVYLMYCLNIILVSYFLTNLFLQKKWKIVIAVTIPIIGVSILDIYKFM